MIISLAKLIFKFFELVAKGCAFLLVKLGLWVPAIFVFCSVIFCALAGITLDETALDIILAGIIITSALSIWLTMVINKASKQAKIDKKQADSGKNKVKRNKNQKIMRDVNQDLPENNYNQTDPNYAQNQHQQQYQQQQNGGYYNGADGSNSYNQQNMNVPPYAQNQQSGANQTGNNYNQQNMNTSPNERQQQQITPEPNLQNQTGENYNQQNMMSSGNNQPNNGASGYGISGSSCEGGYGTRPQGTAQNNDFQSQNNAQNSNTASQTNSQSGGNFGIDCKSEHEQPLIFATRRDPNIFIAEYSDRLVFFRKTKNGMKVLSTERKTRK